MYLTSFNIQFCIFPFCFACFVCLRGLVCVLLPPVRKVNQKLENSHHSFLTDVADMRSMETALVQLVNDFHSGKLQAFGKAVASIYTSSETDSCVASIGRHCSTEQMEAIRDQQEKLARLHFDLGVQQDVVTPHNTDNMNELVSALEHLSQTIEQLHPNASQNQSDSN